MDLVSRIYIEPLQLNNEKEKPNFLNGQMTYIDLSPKKTHK